MLLPQLIGGLLQEKPEVPNFVPIDAQAEQTKAIAGNQKSLPALQALAANANSFNQDQLLAQLRKAIPNYDEMVGKATGLISSQLSGEVPKDVQEMLQRSDAGKALAGGYGGSGMGRNLTARDLGLTSLQLTQQGLDSASRWMQMSRQALTPGLMDISSMFITPVQQIALTVGERNAKFQHDWVGNQLDAQYSLGTIAGQAIIKTDDQIMQIAASVAGSAAGGAMCWVAREVYGEENPKWKQFRAWLLTKAPQWLLAIYLRHGPAIAQLVRRQPALKQELRLWMDGKIQTH